METDTPRIAVLGSINMDLVVRCAALPIPGQTICAESMVESCGGKGANQAIAAARAGADVSMIGRLGEDSSSAQLMRTLREENIDCQGVRITPGTTSGRAIVSVDANGQNSIVYFPGANACLSVEDVEESRATIESSDVLLVQLEVPIETVKAGLAIAEAANVRTILDPAPAPSSCPSDLFNVDLICPNETEAAALTGNVVGNYAEAEAAARHLHNCGVRQVVVTMGEQGTLLFTERTANIIPPCQVNAVDSTGAGDAFAGALAVFWAEYDDLVKAVQLANAAGALAASQQGAQSGLGMRREIESLWRQKV